MLKTTRLRILVAFTIALGCGAFVPWSKDGTPPAHAQTAANYTFTLIAEHNFLQFVLGSGQDETPQVIRPASASISDNGVVAFAHNVNIFAPDRSVVSIGAGGRATQIYGGGNLSPAQMTGIDGEDAAYLLENVTPNNGTETLFPCGPNVFVVCLFNATRTVGIPLAQVPFWTVNGAHSRLRSADAARVVHDSNDAAGIRIFTEHGLVAAPGPDFTSVIAGEFDINASGEVVFMAQTPTYFGIFAARAGQPARAVFLNYANPGIGFVSIHNPVIDDAGRVFFLGYPGTQHADIYRIDPGSQTPSIVVDGNNGDLKSPSNLSVNGAGGLAFLATRGSTSGPLGIYTGPDPIADKVIDVDDQVNGQEIVDLQLPPYRHINNNGLGGAGQIVFGARVEIAGVPSAGFNLYRADPVGTTAKNPYMPIGGKPYKFRKRRLPCDGGCTLYIDPPAAIGYEYTLEPGNPNFESVLLPAFPTVKSYGVQVWTGTGWSGATKVSPNVPYVFPLGGVSRFRVVNIPESLGLDVDDPAAFVTGLTFVSGEEAEITMTPLTAEAPPPPPPLLCDLDSDRDVDRNDINVITGARSVVPSPGDPRDANADGAINIVDARFCTVRCTRPNCGL